MRVQAMQFFVDVPAVSSAASLVPTGIRPSCAASSFRLRIEYPRSTWDALRRIDGFWLFRIVRLSLLLLTPFSLVIIVSLLLLVVWALVAA